MKSYLSGTKKSLPSSKSRTIFITLKSFFVYIVTNPKKTVLYIGITNDLESRIIEHYLNRGNTKTFAGRYHCYKLLYYEVHDTAVGAIEREKEIKDWNRAKKEELINRENPSWTILNDQITGWPPHPDVTGR